MSHGGPIGLSARLPWHAPENALAARVHDRRLRGDLHDLTESNPTRVGLPYPTAALRAAIARLIPRSTSRLRSVCPRRARGGGRRIRFDRGRRRPGAVVLTASSSESCSFLFKLLCDPGDAVLIPEPSYPLFDYLVRLEGAVPVAYRLTFDGVWSIDFASIEQALREAHGRAARGRGRSPSPARTIRRAVS